MKNSKKRIVQSAVLMASSALMISCGGGGSAARSTGGGGGDDSNIGLIALTGDRWESDSYLGRNVNTTSRDGLWVMVGTEHRALEDDDEFEEGDFDRRMVFSVRTTNDGPQIRLCGGALNGWGSLDDAGNFNFADVYEDIEEDTNSEISIQYSFGYLDQQGEDTEAITPTMRVSHNSNFVDRDGDQTVTRAAGGEYIAHKISNATSANLGQIDVFASHFSTPPASIAVVPYLNKQIQIACLNEEKGPVLAVGEASDNYLAQLAEKGIDSLDHTEQLLVAWDSTTGFSGSASFTEAFVTENSPSESNGFITLVDNEDVFNVWISGADNSSYQYSDNVASQMQMEFNAEYSFLPGEKTQTLGSIQLDF